MQQHYIRIKKKLRGVSNDVTITLWAVKNYAHHFYRCMGAKIQAYTPGKLKIIRNEPILQTVTDLKKITQIVVSELIFRCWPWYNLTLIFDLHITNTSYWCKLTFLTLSHWIWYQTRHILNNFNEVNIFNRNFGGHLENDVIAKKGLHRFF